MNISISQTEKLLQGNYRFRQLGFSMLLTRLKKNYIKAPSQATLQSCASEINTFLDKYKSIMADDFTKIADI